MESLTQDEEKRIARLQKYVTKVEEAQEEMMRAINSGEMEGYSEEEVRFYLSHTPNMIAEAGLFLAKMQRAYEYSKVDTKVILAKIWKKCNQHKDQLGLTNAKDREAYVQTDPEYIKAQQQEIEWKYRLNQMQVIYDRYEDMYISCRKLASMIPTLNKAQDSYVKYNREYGIENE